MYRIESCFSGTNTHEVPMQPKRGVTKCLDVHRLGSSERIKVGINTQYR
ncbi:hypothetical protein SLEP1_g6635 [Rubroshorea leprosula]|uniref:Uncharacterized protein n=1 Tax=Rubroshorea leprosula TaxID=152421 RepID=A0AAV5I517_9ROSI|nr:hypothetical protein SLEP1_g6635 [Rubroshorea leprosula]